MASRSESPSKVSRTITEATPKARDRGPPGIRGVEMGELGINKELSRVLCKEVRERPRLEQ